MAKMKFISFVIVLLAVILAGAVGYFVLTRDETVNWKIYTDGMHRLSLKYPPHWTAADDYVGIKRELTKYLIIEPIRGHAPFTNELLTKTIDDAIRLIVSGSRGPNPFGVPALGDFSIRNLLVDGQEARLIIPSDPKYPSFKAILVVRFPQPLETNNGGTLYFLRIEFKQDEALEDIIKTIRFEVLPQPSELSEVEFISPRGGEKFVIGEPLFIQWTELPPNVTAFGLLLSQRGTGSRIEIGDSDIRYFEFRQSSDTETSFKWEDTTKIFIDFGHGQTGFWDIKPGKYRIVMRFRTFSDVEPFGVESEVFEFIKR